MNSLGRVEDARSGHWFCVKASLLALLISCLYCVQCECASGGVTQCAYEFQRAASSVCRPFSLVCCRLFCCVLQAPSSQSYWAFLDSPTSASHLSASVQKLQICGSTSGFAWALGIQRVWPHANVTSALSPESRPLYHCPVLFYVALGHCEFRFPYWDSMHPYKTRVIWDICIYCPVALGPSISAPTSSIISLTKISWSSLARYPDFNL